MTISSEEGQDMARFERIDLVALFAAILALGGTAFGLIEQLNLQTYVTTHADLTAMQERRFQAYFALRRTHVFDQGWIGNYMDDTMFRNRVNDTIEFATLIFPASLEPLCDSLSGAVQAILHDHPHDSSQSDIHMRVQGRCDSAMKAELRASDEALRTLRIRSAWRLWP